MSGAPVIHAFPGARGFVILPVMIIALMLGGLALGLYHESLGERRAVLAQEDSLQALELAELALVRSATELHAGEDPDGDGLGSVAGGRTRATWEAECNPHPEYDHRWTVLATGVKEHAQRRVEAGFRRRAGGYWVEGLFAKDALTFDGSTQTDSYDSRLGSYASQATNFDSQGTFGGMRGHIGSNQGIQLNGSSVMIRGNAVPGPLDVVSTSGSPVVRGDRYPRQVEVELPDPAFDEFERAMTDNQNHTINPPGQGGGGGSTSGGGGGNRNGNGGNGNGGGGGGGNGSGPYNPANMTLRATAGETVVLTEGTYFFRDLTLTGGATLRATGPVKIYVTGAFDPSGGAVVNAGGVPGEMQVFVHPHPLPAGNAPRDSQVKIRGGSSVSMAIYAPEVPVSIHGGDDFYGAIVGKTISVAGGGYFHYDEALGDIDHGVEVVLERLYWRELGSVRR